MQPSALGHQIVGRTQALAVWKELLRSRALLTRVVERAGTGERPEIIGFGSSVFVTPEFVDAEINNPRPGIVSRVIASVAEKKPVLLNRQQVARGNGRAGLDAVFLSSVWWDTSNPVEFSEMMMASVGSCLEAHAGYRVRSLTVEVSGLQHRCLAAASVGFDTVKEFCDVDRVLLRMRKEGPASVATNAANLFFRYREPRLDLPSADQQLLLAALKGVTDRELAAQLGLNLATVKRRWRSIFSKVEDLAPELFKQSGGRNDGKRGPQRRHVVVAYVREHPEELRPFERESNVDSCRGKPDRE